MGWQVLWNGMSAYAVWCLLVLGAARGFSPISNAVAVLLIASQVLIHASRRHELRRILILTIVGTAIDSMLIRAGVYTPVGYSGMLCPLWISLLWANFATTLNSSLGWLRGQPLFAASLGAIAGPASYAAAVRLGAAELHTPQAFHLSVLASVWALLMAAVFSRGRMAFRRAAALVGILSVCTPSFARERTVGGVAFPEEVTVHGVRLTLLGAGVLRYRVIFNGYAAALYVAPGVAPGEVLGDVPKRLEIHYFWSIPAESFAKAADEFLQKNLPEDQLKAVRGRADELHKAYEAVRPGDRYALTYIPGIGTELTLNNVLKARIPGADFASAYFTIWLGNDPISLDLRKALLGNPLSVSSSSGSR
ncbi:MAG: DUF2878 family protein [Candidatus Binatia bacterium]|nr:DUF2878 family protein [Candidatus Binatia bacterium]